MAEPEQNNNDLIPNQSNNNEEIGKEIWLVPLYTLAYSLFAIWLLIDGWLTGFSPYLEDLRKVNYVPLPQPVTVFALPVFDQ